MVLVAKMCYCIFEISKFHFKRKPLVLFYTLGDHIFKTLILHNTLLYPSVQNAIIQMI